MTQTFTVTAERGTSGWWVLEQPDLGVVSQVRRLDQVDEEMREVIAHLAGIPEADVVIDVVPVLPEAYMEHAERAARFRESEAAARAEAATQARAAAKALRATGMPLRDVGTIMGISHQRAAQLAA